MTPHGLITRRSQVQILPPPPSNTRSEALSESILGEGLLPFSSRRTTRAVVQPPQRPGSTAGFDGLSKLSTVLTWDFATAT